MRKKKAMILTVGLISVIPLSACAKESNAVPVESTQVETVAETEADLNISIGAGETEEIETVSEDLAKQASKEIAEIESLEAEDKIIYSDESGDIIAIIDEEESETYTNMMDKLREDTKAGRVKAEHIEDTVTTLFTDFLTEAQQKEFISELNSLLPQEKPVASTQPASTPKPTQPAPTQAPPAQPVQQETIPPAEITQPETYPVSDKIDTSGWGEGFQREEPGTESHLTPEQIERINNIEIN